MPFPSTLPICSPFTSHWVVRTPTILQTSVTFSAWGNQSFFSLWRAFWVVDSWLACILLSLWAAPSSKKEWKIHCVLSRCLLGRRWNMGLLVLRWVSQMLSTEAHSLFLFFFFSLSFNPSSLFPDLWGPSGKKNLTDLMSSGPRSWKAPSPANLTVAS